jgi:hypothetical protein
MKTELNNYLDVSISQQMCHLYSEGKLVFEAAISTALNGIGQQKNSGCTPLGWHKIRACIGHNHAINTVFIGRRPTGEIYNDQLAQQFPERDWILSRILWLSGLELGQNRLGNVDTMQRYIYIHGCPDHLPMGVALSHGCIRMHNSDVIALYEQVSPGFKVYIHE